MPIRFPTLTPRSFDKIRVILRALPRSIRNNLRFVMITGIINAALEVSSVFLLSIFIEKATSAEASPNYSLNSQYAIQNKLYSLNLFDLGLFVIGITLLLATGRFLNIKSTAVASQAVSSELSRFFVGSVLKSEFINVLNINQSEFVALAVSKNLSFVKYIIFPLTQLIVSSFTVLAFLIVLLRFSSSAELLALLSLVFLFSCATLYTRQKVTHSALKISESFDSIVKILNRIIQGFREIKVTNRAEFIRKQFELVDSSLLKAETTTRIYSLSPRVIIEAIIVIFIVMFICLKSPTPDKIISISWLVTVLLITQRTLPHIQNISFGITSMRAGRTILDDIYREVVKFSLNESYRQEGTLVNSSHAKLDYHTLQLHSNQDIRLQFSNVSFRYSKDSMDSILTNLSFELREGDCLALLGKSGSGKTTILDLASGLLSPTNGTIVFDNIGCKLSNHSKISYVTQKPFTIDGTIAQNITLFSDSNKIASDLELIKACEKADLFSPTSHLKLDSLLVENGSNLSGGQLTRLSMVRALISDPSLLLLDEPTASLDPKTELIIIQNLKNILPSKICIIATHRPKPLELCNSFLLLDDGKLSFLSKQDSLKFLSSNPSQ